MKIEKILLIDDSKTELLFLSTLLRKHGFLVNTAENADEAFNQLAEQRPDLILMDVVMPGQNGFQLTRILSRNKDYSSIPIIICSSKNQETDKLWGLRQGARDYITKPVDIKKLIGKIKSIQ